MQTQYSSIFKAASTLAALLLVGTSLQAESLWLKAEEQGTARNQLTDYKASQRGDLLTIVVDQSTTMATTINTTTTKESNIQNAVNRWLFSTAASGFGTHNEELPATDISAEQNYGGGGTVTNTQTFNTTFAVQVIDRLPNGNLVVEGHRLIAMSEEKQYLVLIGTVSPRDISSDNTVLSSRIANAEIISMSEGAISTAQEKGWLLQINDLINPF